MRNLTKVLALVLAIAMMVSVAAFAKTYTDVESDANYAEAVDVLSDLGLVRGYEDGTFGADKTLTRAEGAAFVLRLMGLEEAAIAATGSETGFSDVPASHWASGYVSVAAANGVVVGMGDGTFEPDSELTYAQIVKMIVVALGYDPLVAELGEWPNNYISAATQIKLTTGIPGKADDAVSRATTARLMYSALTVPKMEKSGIGVNATWAPGENMILDDLGFFKVKGTATNVNVIENSATLNIDKQCLSVVGSGNNATGKYKETSDPDDWTISYSGSAASGYTKKIDLGDFGTEIKNSEGVPCIFYIADDDDYTVASFVEQSNVVSSLTINTADYKSHKDGKVTYYTDNAHTKSTTAKLNDSVTVYVNGGDAQVYTDLDDLMTDYFDNNADDYEIELKDTDDDGKYDMAVITSYKYMVVKTIKVKSGVYTFTSESDVANPVGTFTIDTDNDDTAIKIYKDGEEIGVDEIEKGDVLNVAVAEQSSKELIQAKIYVTNESVEGTVKYNEHDDKVVTFNDGNDYGYLLSDDDKYLESGAEGTYYLNIGGSIIYVSDADVKSSYTYAYATLIALKYKSKVQSGTIRVLGTDGKWATLDLYKTVNGVSLDSLTGSSFTTESTSNALKLGKNAYVSYNSNSEIDLVVNDIIVYKTNSAGAVKEIIVGTTNIAKATDDEAKPITSKKYSDGEVADYYVGASTVVYSMNEAIASTDDDVEDHIKVTDRSVFKDDDDVTATLYGIDDEDVIGVMIGQFDSAIDFESDMFVVSKSLQTTTDDDDKIIELTGYQGGEEVVYKYYYEDSDISEFYAIDLTGTNVAIGDGVTIKSYKDIKKGDILFVNVDANGVISKAVRYINILTGVSNGEFSGTLSATISDAVTKGDDKGGFIAAYVLGVKNSKVYYGTTADKNFDVEKKEDLEATPYVSISDKANITVYDATTDKNNLSEGDVSDISENTLLFARLNENNKIVEAVVVSLED